MMSCKSCGTYVGNKCIRTIDHEWYCVPCAEKISPPPAQPAAEPRCPTCRRPLATDADWERYPGGEGDHLCWARDGACQQQPAEPELGECSNIFCQFGATITVSGVPFCAKCSTMKGWRSVEADPEEESTVPLPGAGPMPIFDPHVLDAPEPVSLQAASISPAEPCGGIRAKFETVKEPPAVAGQGRDIATTCPHCGDIVVYNEGDLRAEALAVARYLEHAETRSLTQYKGRPADALMDLQRTIHAQAARLRSAAEGKQNTTPNAVRSEPPNTQAPTS